jgi:hydrogenase nickel incorporation protein HypA/HybF
LKAGGCLHELGLMQQVIHILRESVQKEGIKRVSSIKLVVGKMTAAQPDSLKFAFEVLSKSEDWLNSAELTIIEIDLTARCLICKEQYSVTDYRFVCPICGSVENQIESGRELYLDFYEGD